MEDQECILKVIYRDELLWDVIPEVYKKMPGWLGYDKNNIPYWFSYKENKKMICASVEPPGIQFTGNMEEKEWNLWVLKLKKYTTELLGYTVEIFIY